MDTINQYISPHKINLRYDLVEQRVINSFHNRVNISFITGCWEWTGGKKVDGYGIFGSIRDKKLNNKYQTSHRMSWLIHYGEIPIGLFVCHKCDNRVCCNPDHLFLGTQKENIADMIKKHRYVKGKIYKGIESCQYGENSPFHKLTTEKVLEIRKYKETGNYSSKVLGDVYGVSGTTIDKICNGEKWAWLR